MRLLTGTSGFSYKAWKGSFYPDDLPDKEMLRYYGERLSTVEINNTFYRMPKLEMLRGWTEMVPADFVFVIKASQRITHRSRLKNAQDSVGYLWSALAGLGEHRGPVLFQLPPNFKKDADRLRAFVAGLPADCRSVFEFRHASWDDEETLTILRDGGAALCAADMEEGEPPALEATAEWGYLRLRKQGYDDGELEDWVTRIRAMPWEEVFVFFKHEDEGVAPALALRFRELFEGAP